MSEPTIDEMLIALEDAFMELAGADFKDNPCYEAIRAILELHKQRENEIWVRYYPPTSEREREIASARAAARCLDAYNERHR